MTKRFLNKYRIPSARLQNWDYGWNGIYFITICTEGRDNYFGNITEQVMELSEIGLFAQKIWFEIPGHFTFVDLDAFIVMPNHIHGIVIIDKKVPGETSLGFDCNIDSDIMNTSFSRIANSNGFVNIFAPIQSIGRKINISAGDKIYQFNPRVETRHALSLHMPCLYTQVQHN